MAFTNVSLPDLSGFVITPSDAVIPLFDTPASYYNKSRSGIPYSMPNMDVYNLIDPVIPSVDPGGDLTFTKTGFRPKTGMPTLIIQATPGLEYAVVDATGRILTKEDREKCMITAETLDGLDVMPDKMNFYSTQSKEMRFLVPPGGGCTIS